MSQYNFGTIGVLMGGYSSERGDFCVPVVPWRMLYRKKVIV